MMKRAGAGSMRRALLGAAAICALAGPAGAVAVEQDLSRLSLEELADVQITSVSRRPEPVGEAPAAIYVISADDIRRSGAASLPEVLRLAPNLQVQRVNAADYAISARGFNGFETSNKLLVLIDGRSVYSPLHSGVFWDIRSAMLENIDRIEVISGPGGTLFGANAVNGVINIISRSAADTQGSLLAVGAGNEDRTLSLRHGGTTDTVAWRVYATAFERDDSFRETGEDATDAASGVRGGARADWTVGANTLSLRGEVFRNRMRINEDFSGVGTRADGGHIMGEWVRAFEGAGQLQVQGYFDRTELAEPGLLERNDIADLHIQHTVGWSGRHNIVWGGGYRVIDSEVRSAPGSAFIVPSQLTMTLANVFAQDQIDLTDALTLTLGLKYEDHSVSGQEVLPSARLAWSRRDGSLFWGAVSRAARTPSRIEMGLTFPGVLAPLDFQSETLVAYELGYRANPSPTTAISVSAFYNDYDAIRSLTFTPVTILPFSFANDVQGRTFGVEAWGSWDVHPRWRLSAGVSTLDKEFEVKPGQTDIGNLAATGDDPAYQVLLRSQAELSDAIELDMRLRAVDELDASGVDAYVEADARLGWWLNERIELAVSGQNLLNERRLETGDAGRRREFGRSVYANLRWSF